MKMVVAARVDSTGALVAKIDIPKGTWLYWPGDRMTVLAKEEDVDPSAHAIRNSNLFNCVATPPVSNKDWDVR